MSELKNVIFEGQSHWLADGEEKLLFTDHEPIQYIGYHEYPKYEEMIVETLFSHIKCFIKVISDDKEIRLQVNFNSSGAITTAVINECFRPKYANNINANNLRQSNEGQLFDTNQRQLSTEKIYNSMERAVIKFLKSTLNFEENSNDDKANFERSQRVVSKYATQICELKAELKKIKGF